MNRFLIFISFVLLNFYSHAHEKEVNYLEIGEIYVLPDLVPLTQVSDDLDPLSRHSFIFDIRNTSSFETSSYISFTQRYIFAEEWVLIIDGDTVQKKKSSTDFHVIMKANQKARVILTLNELDLQSPNGFQLIARCENDYEKEIEEINKSQAFVVGILLFLFAFNLVLNLITKWRVYGIYSIYILSALLYFVYYFGLIQAFFIDPTSISINAMSILFGLIFTFYFLFIIDLGNLRVTNPKAAYFLMLGIYYQIFQIVVEISLLLFGYSFYSDNWYKILFLSLEMILMGFIIYHFTKAKTMRARIVIYGTLVIVLFAILAQLDTGYNPMYVLEVGILLELLTFSIGLGYISRQYYRDKNMAEELYIKELEKNQDNQEKLNEKLEKLVEERTAHLEETMLELEKRNSQNKVLIGEVHHRVKNNLQLITSMLNMQNRQTKNAESKTAISEALNRISTIGLLHEQLYKDENTIDINLRTYIEELWNKLSEANGNNVWNFDIQTENIRVNMDIAFKVGVIINELLVNILKYSKPDSDEHVIRLGLKMDSENLHIEVLDNGKNKDKSVNEGFGYNLIKILTGESKNPEVLVSDSEFKVKVVLPI